LSVAPSVPLHKWQNSTQVDRTPNGKRPWPARHESAHKGATGKAKGPDHTRDALHR